MIGMRGEMKSSLKCDSNEHLVFFLLFFINAICFTHFCRRSIVGCEVPELLKSILFDMGFTLTLSSRGLSWR